MLFSFLKYIKPILYFNQRRHDGTHIYPDYDNLPEDLKNKFDLDSDYESKVASQYDVSWRVIQKGYVEEFERIKSIEPVLLIDEYIFIRKYFNSIWATYCLILRILCFKNIFREIKAFRNSRCVKRQPIENLNLYRDKWEAYKLNQTPKIAIVIPTLNRYHYLKDVLQDFEKQDYANFKLIIVDQSDNFDRSFYNDFDLDIKIIRQTEKALWLARNTAILSSRASIIGLSEDDVRIKPDWISNHLKCLILFNADISAGVFYPEGSEILEKNAFFSISQQFATGNAMFYKKILLKTGLFDRQFEKQRMGDGEFGLRCYLEGFKSISNPFASCIDVKAPVGGLRELGSWDAYRPTKWFLPRPVPSVLYYYRKYYGNKLALLELIKTVPVSIIPYKFKRNKKMKITGIFISILIFPLILFQVLRSWNFASVKLSQGARIDALLNGNNSN